MKWCLVLWCLVVLSVSAFSQITLSLGAPNLHAGKVGLGIDGISGSPDFLVKYFFSSQFAGQLVAGANLDVPGGDPLPGMVKVTGLDLRGGLALLYHLTQDQVSPYVGAEGTLRWRKEGGFFEKAPEGRKIVNTSAVFGAEYYFNDRICLGIKQALGVDLLLKRDVPKEETDVRLSTSTLLTGRFFFN